MDSHRRNCEKIGKEYLIDREIDSVVHDLENWRKRFAARTVSFELGPRPTFSPVNPPGQHFLMDIQQIMDLFDREPSTDNSVQDIAAIHHSFSISPENKAIDHFEREIKQEKSDDSTSSSETHWSGKSDYFKVKNPSELFKLNQAFIDELKNGANHFAICSLNSSSDRISTCWGIASAMNFMVNRQVAIICDKVGDEYFAFASSAERQTLVMERYGIEIPFWKNEGISLFSIYDFVDVIYNLSPAAVQTFLNEFAYCVGIVIWDLPAVSQVDAKRHLYIPIFEALSSLSIVINRGEDMRQLDKLIGFYQRYGVKILGAIYGKKEQDV